MLSNFYSILEISTTVGCRHLCDYCPQGVIAASYKGERMMTWETYVQCLSSIPAGVSICFSGFAEPWQNPRCSSMIMYAALAGHTVSVFTTTSGMTEEDVNDMAAVVFKHFCVHLPDESGRIKIVVDEHYLSILEMCRDKVRGCTFMCIGKVDPRVSRIANVGDGSLGLWSRAGNLKSPSVEHKTGPLACSSHPELKHNLLLPNGDVVLCCMDYGMKHVLGNLMDQNYNDLFETDSYKSVMRALGSDDQFAICRKCEVARAV